MKRFLMVVASVVALGALYVASAPGSQQAGPSARQFKALKKQVAKLQKDQKLVKEIAFAEASLLLACMADTHPINQFGDDVNHTKGYTYTDPALNGGLPFMRAALDYTATTDPTGFWITGGKSDCNTQIHGALRTVSRLARRPGS